MTSRRSKATKAETKPKRLRALARPTRSRDDFPQSVVDYLADEVGNFCSICHRPTSGPSAEPNKNSNAGTAAHITAASRNGPRHDETISTKQRRSAENGIWCCRVHGKLIDDDVSTFTVEMLSEAKARAIDRARRSLLTGDPDPDGYRKQAHVTRHQIAQKVARAIDHVRWTMPAAAQSWSSWRADNQRSGELLVALDRFRMCIEEVHQARDEVRVVWGEHTAAPLQSFGDMCSILRTGIILDVRRDVPQVMNDRAFEDGKAGGRSHELILEYATLIEAWAAPYLGREGATELTEDELAARSWRIHGFPEDQIQEIVESGRVVRAAKRAGSSRKEIMALIEQRNAARETARMFAIAPLGSGDVSAQSIIDELGRVITAMVARGETELNVRLDEPFDAALAAALEASPGAIAVLGQQVQGFARLHPSIKSVLVTANGLAGVGWKFG